MTLCWSQTSHKGIFLLTHDLLCWQGQRCCMWQDFLFAYPLSEIGRHWGYSSNGYQTETPASCSKQLLPQMPELLILILYYQHFPDYPHNSLFAWRNFQQKSKLPIPLLVSLQYFSITVYGPWIQSVGQTTWPRVARVQYLLFYIKSGHSVWHWYCPPSRPCSLEKQYVTFYAQEHHQY